MLPVTPTFTKLRMLLLARRDHPLRERTKRSHKWTNASAVTPIAADNWSAPHSVVLLEIVVFWGGFVASPQDNKLQLFHKLNLIISASLLHGARQQNISISSEAVKGTKTTNKYRMAILGSLFSLTVIVATVPPSAKCNGFVEFIVTDV